MASIVLGAVGSIIGGPFGGAAGALLGGYVDQNFLFPALFPAQTVEGPRVNELKIQSADEGAYAHFIVGGSARVAGTIIWISDIVEVKTEEEQGGGKGGGGSGGSQKFTTYSYFVDVAIAIAMQPGVSVDKIYAEGKLVYNANPNVSISSSAIAVSVLGSGSRARMRLTSTSADLSQLAIGYDVTVSGFGSAGNNGTFKVLSTTRDRSTGTTYATLENSGASTEAAGAAATLTQTIPPYDPVKVQEITFYPGDAAPTPDPLIQAYEGAVNTPAFSGTAYVLLKQFALGDYGNRVPHFAILARANAATVQSAFSTVYTRSGRSSSEIDVTGLSGAMDGYATTGPFSPANAFQPLALAFDVLAQESSGALRFFHRRNATIVEVDEVDLATHEYGGDAPRPLEIETDPRSEAPSEANVKHVDLEAEDQSGSQRERKRDYTSDGVVNVDLPIAMTGAKARGIARRLLWVAWANRKKFRLQLPPRYMHVQENDCLRVKALGEPWLLLVNRVDFGVNGVIQVEAVLEIRDVLTQVEEADAPYTGATSLAGQSDDDEAMLYEIGPPGFGVPSDAPQITVGVTTENGNPFSGCQVFHSDDDENYLLWESLATEATLGYATTVLSGTGVSSAYWDRVSTVDVYVFKGELASADEIFVLNGGNRALLGGEVIGFATATLIATNTYRLSNLLRGLRDTEPAMTTHAAGEDFALASNATKSKTFPLAWIGKTKYFRFVFASQALADAETRTLEITGATLKPFAPASLTVNKDDFGNVTAEIRRCTRAVVRLFSPAIPPLYEQEEGYSVDVVYPAGSGTIVRTIAATSATFSYSEGQQTTDGVTPLDPIEYRVHQVSQIYGRGRALVVVA